MKNQIRKLNQGFTIIEVMIVLAIAGLILAIVFIAVPQLQRNTRDNNRQNIANRIKAEIETYAGNNQGTYPFAGVSGAQTTCNGQVSAGLNCGNWFGRYICSDSPYVLANGCSSAGTKVRIVDPSTGKDTLIQYSNVVANPGWVAGNLYIAVGSKCLGENLQAGTSLGTATSKQYAVLMSLDRTNTFYCIDNG